MIDSRSLATNAAAAHSRMAKDIGARARETPEPADVISTEYQRARTAERTLLSESRFTAALIDQAAQSWVLSLILVRFLEDTGLIEAPIVSGPGSADQRARDALTLHFRAHPEHSEREYLEHSFRALADLPGLHELFGPEHQLLYALGPSADAAKELIEFFRKKDPATGDLVHDFTDSERDTRFLGDIYQHLSEEARKRYALLQTPDFIERFILDRTLEPAIREFGLEETSLIDPACGSGHFLLGAFGRLFGHWRAREPHTEPRLIAQRCLDQIAGVDLNPVAIAIARFRLLVAALSASKSRVLKEAPDFRIHLAAGDSLLHGPRPGQLRGAEGSPARRHHYRAEDAETATRILGRAYTCVVGNPPYITPKDPAENAAYRARYGSCHRQYHLSVPFTERFFDLASTAPQPGYVGAITDNAFMKREYGTKLVKEYLSTWDLTHVIDTSGAYIPGHGTPTVILLARNRPPTEPTVRCALGIRGEPSPPQDPAEGRVWSAITVQVDLPGSESDFVSVVDMPREQLSKHPWSLSGGGAGPLGEAIFRAGIAQLGERSDEMGFGVVTREDDVFLVGRGSIRRAGVDDLFARVLVAGDEVRDWAVAAPTEAFWPYDAATLEPAADASLRRSLWPWRAQLSGRIAYGRSQIERGLEWFEYSMFFRERFRIPLSISLAFVATHNHFVLDRGGKVFKQTAPVIKLPAGSTEEDHLALLGPLNSSAGCFWLKQTMFDRGNGGYGGGIADQEWERFIEHDSTKLARFPLAPNPPTDLARTLDSLAQVASANTPAAICEREVPTRACLDAAHQTWHSARRKMIAHQEELDWRCYRLYGITDDDLTYSAEPPEVAFAERAFEIALARKVASGDMDTAWFTRHRAEPRIEIPDHWPVDYRDLVERRIALIESSRDIGLIERPEYKRRWAHEPWEAQEQKVLRSWLLDRMEEPRFWVSDPAEMQSIARLSDRLRADDDFLAVLSLYMGRSDHDLSQAVTDLAEGEAVPYLAALRYTDAGMAKRAEWEQVWELQRREDQGEDVGKITPPPRYVRTDYRSGSYWTHRGKLDVPKERFISYPGAEREADPSAVIGWAGWDHRQRAIALASRIQRAQDAEGWSTERLVPLLAGLHELIPWLIQWHNEPDEAGTRFGDFVQSFLRDRTARAGLSVDALEAWRPPAPARGRRRERVEG